MASTKEKLSAITAKLSQHAWPDFCFYVYIVDFSNIIMSFISKDFLNADANCPGYVITAFEMIEMLKNQGAEGKMNQSYL